jgi:hypothetical protein
MELRILGCNGGIGGRSRTATMLLDEDILNDLGTGLGNYNAGNCDRARDLIIAFKHVFPSLLAEELAKLKHPTQILIAHPNPRNSS